MHGVVRTDQQSSRRPGPAPRPRRASARQPPRRRRARGSRDSRQASACAARPAGARAARPSRTRPRTPCADRAVAERRALGRDTDDADMPRQGRCHRAMLATSAAKSSSGPFSTPSPTAKRTKPVTFRPGTRLLHRLRDGQVGVHHELLPEQADFLVELVQPADDHLLDHRVRLAGLARLLGQHLLLALDQRRVEVVDVQRGRRGRGDVHRHLPADLRRRRAVAAAIATSTPILPMPSATWLWT